MTFLVHRIEIDIDFQNSKGDVVPPPPLDNITADNELKHVGNNNLHLNELSQLVGFISRS